MRIVIDLQGVQSESRFRGIGRYTLSLALAIVRQRGEHEIVLALNGLFPDTIEPIRAAFDGLLPQTNIRVWYAPSPVKQCHEVNRWRGQVARYLRESFLAALQPDVLLLSSLFEGYGDDAVTSIGEFAPELPTVAMLYDLIPLIHAETYLNPHERYRDFYLTKLQQLKKADAWLTISASSTQEAVDHLQIDCTSITDISAACDPVFKPLAISGEEKEKLEQHFGINRPYVLYSGGADVRKNLPQLIRVFAGLDVGLRDRHQLVMVGKIEKDNRKNFSDLAKSCGMEADDLIFTGNISDQQLCQLYNLCQAYVFPSLHEGFGLPVLEAMSCQVPVIASNTSSLPEVVGMAGALFDPLDENDMRNKLTRVLSDQPFRERLIAHGNAQAKKYSWEHTASKALAALEALPCRRPASPMSAAECSSALTTAITGIEGDFSDADLRQCAAAIALNHPLPRQKTIFVDISELVQRDAATGVQRVTKSILCQLLDKPPADYLVEAVYATGDASGYRSARQFVAKLLNKSQEQDDELIDPIAGDIFLGLDLQHHTTRLQAPYLNALRSRGIAVYFVVYDLLPIQFPQYWPSLHPVHSEWLQVLAQFDGAICISRAVAAELAEWLKSNGPARMRPYRIGWFHLGADIDNSTSSRGLPAGADEVLAKLAARPTFLVVGTLEPRKGQAQALAAFEQLWAEGQALNLVLVGKQGWLVEHLADQLRRHPEQGGRLFWLEGVSDEYLAKIYSVATCLILPSEGEGFGLPLIEAAQLGLPIIATDIPVFREVAGDFATYFSGKTPEALALVVKNWLCQQQAGQTPDVSAMPWLTWAESAEQLKRVICEESWLLEWPDASPQGVASAQAVTG